VVKPLITIEVDAAAIELTVDIEASVRVSASSLLNIAKSV